MPVPLPSPLEAVLFDRDDTLSLTDRDVYRQAALWLQEHAGLDPQVASAGLLAQWRTLGDRWRPLRTLEDEERFWHQYGVELAARLNLSEQQGHDMVREWPYWRYLVPVPGLREVLTTLRSRGLKIGVLSNTVPDIGVTLRAVGVEDLIDVALASCTLGVHKPDPDVFLRAAEQLGVPRAGVLFVDDLMENVEAARHVGMRALLIDHSGQHGEAIHQLSDVLLEVERITANLSS